MVRIVIEGSVEGMYVLDAVQRRITEMAETEMTAGSFEAETVEMALGILGRVERRLRDTLYPTEPMFPFLEDFPADMTAARLAAETEAELREAWGK